MTRSNSIIFSVFTFGRQCKVRSFAYTIAIRMIFYRVHIAMEITMFSGDFEFIIFGFGFLFKFVPEIEKSSKVTSSLWSGVSNWESNLFWMLLYFCLIEKQIYVFKKNMLSTIKLVVFFLSFRLSLFFFFFSLFFVTASTLHLFFYFGM